MAKFNVTSFISLHSAMTNQSVSQDMLFSIYYFNNAVIDTFADKKTGEWTFCFSLDCQVFVNKCTINYSNILTDNNTAHRKKMYSFNFIMFSKKCYKLLMLLEGCSAFSKTKEKAKKPLKSRYF